MDRTEALDAVLRRLPQPDDGPHGRVLRLVAGRLAAPGRTVNAHFAVHDTQHRVVVVEQFRPGNVVQPQLTVRTLAGAALPEEQEAAPAAHDRRRMHFQRSVRRRSEGEQQHQRIVHGKGLVGRTAFGKQPPLPEISAHLQHPAYSCAGPRRKRRLVTVAAPEKAHDRLAGLLLRPQQRLPRRPRRRIGYFQVEERFAGQAGE